jgi:beta-lactamase regulating signal transducer with metallopeptidase domain
MLEWFAETTIVAAILAVVAVLVCRLRPSSPSIRHALWMVVLIKLITPPLISWPWAARLQDLAWPGASPEVIIVSAPPDRKRSDPAILPVEPEPLESEVEDSGPALVEIDDTPSPVLLASSEAIADEPERQVTQTPASPRTWTLRSSLPASDVLARWTVLTWLAVSVVLGVGQAIRIIQFRRRLRQAMPAPDNLVEEAGHIGRCLDVSVPTMLVVPDLGTPLLWCLGQPLLLLPEALVKTLPFDRWRGILTHELAHLRRGDHWVSRLELAAGLIWWWNPLYWLTRARLDAEAELACDAWVILTLPKDRLAYAEVLLDICANLSLAKPAAPTLGVAGSGRFFEQRLTMILHDRVRCRLSPLALLGATLLVLFALPSWLVANAAIPSVEEQLASLSNARASGHGIVTSVFDDDDDKAVKRKKDADDDDDDADDDDDDDDDDKAAARAKAEAEVEAARAKLEAAQAKLEAAKAQADSSKNKAQKSKSKDKKSEKEFDFNFDFSGIQKEIESKLGPEFEKKMEELGEKIAKEMEAKFGPDFEKKMEALGDEIESKFGPEFEKKMEAFGKEIEAKLGPDSEFAKKMEAFGKEMEEKFGPDSDFVKKIKEKAAKGGSVSEGQTNSPKSSSSAKDGTKAVAKIKSAKRERRIKELEAQIKKLMDEVKSLEENGDQDDDNAKD